MNLVAIASCDNISWRQQNILGDCDRISYVTVTESPSIDNIILIYAPSDKINCDTGTRTLGKIILQMLKEEKNNRIFCRGDKNILGNSVVSDLISYRIFCRRQDILSQLAIP